MFMLMNFYLMILLIYLFMMFLYFFLNQMIYFIEIELMNLLSIKIEFLILIDWITLLFISVVLFITLMVIFYSLEYMEGNLNINRFMLLIFMFVLSMILMIISPNLLSILLGWDGLGLVSYCLVIYYQNINSFNCGMVTVLTNRLGDIMFLMSISLMLIYGSWNFMFMKNINSLIYLLLMMASFTKSAQIPFSSWLPMAMAAPTPVSSLVHSSTLVTAGVYLMIRLNYMMENYYLMKLMMGISLVTLFMSGLGANFEFDLKKIIALSTLSQLGLMIFCLSLKLMEISLFHLLTHAMFKSMLFMCSGVIIHNMLGNQDIRFISMTLYNLPLVSMFFNCSLFSLFGIPFMSGFFSKDLILEMYLMNMMNKFILIMLFISMGFTIMYSFRLMYYSFIKVPQLQIYVKYYTFSSKMGVSIYLLFFFSIFMGGSLSWIMFSMKNLIFLTVWFKLMIYFFMLLGMLISLIFSKFYLNKKMILSLNNFSKFFSMMWFLPMLYSIWVPVVLKFSGKVFLKIDLGWIEYLTFNLMKKIIMNFFKLDFFNKSYFLIFSYLVIIMFLLLF